MTFTRPSYLLPAEIPPAAGLELDDDLSELDVPFLLQLGQDACPEEHLGVPDPIGGWV